jgi:hypothetical protein
VYAFYFTRHTLQAFVLSFLSKSDAAKLATLHAFQCKRITPTPANTPIYSGTHPLNNSKCAEIGRKRTPDAARPQNGLTRNRPAHTPRTPTHTRDAHAPARHARQRTHTHTHTHASAHTRTHAHTPTHTGGRTRTRTRSHPRTRRGPRARAHARPRTGGTSRAAPSAMQTRPL